MLTLPLHVHSAQKRPGFPGLFLFMERQLASISPGEAAIEVMCSSALILVAWRHRFAAFFIPPFLMRFVGRFLQDHLVLDPIDPARRNRSEEHTSELQSLMRNSYAVF